MGFAAASNSTKRRGPIGNEPVPWNLGGLTPRQFGFQYWEKAQQHELFTRAAAVAFYAIAALVPFLAMVLTLAARLLPDLTGRRGDATGIGNLTIVELQGTVRRLVPPGGARIIEVEIARLQARPASAIVSVGLVVTVWLSSSLFLAIISGLNQIRGVAETRPVWRLRLTAAVMAIGQSTILVGTLAVIVLWPQLLTLLGFDPPRRLLATVVKWVLVLAMIGVSFTLTLDYAPNTRRSWAWITPGGLAGTLMLVAASLAFRLYIQYGGLTSVTYGSLGGVIALLGWMWMCAFVLFSAALINTILSERHLDTRLPKAGSPPETRP